MAINKFKEFSVKTLDILEKAIVGIEFEFYSKIHFHKLIEILNNKFKPIKVHGFTRYHHPFVPTVTDFKIEPDISGGPNMVEFITGPLPYQEAKLVLLKTLNFLEEYAFTTDKCSIHVNVSFNDDSGKTLSRLNPLKLIMKVDENIIYKYFPSREKNIYAKSIKKILPPDGHIAFDENIDSIVNSLKLPNTKYYGVNFSNIQKNRIEWRYIGGKDYHKKKSAILELFDMFILNTWDSIDTSLSELEKQRLIEYLVKNKERFKMFETYDDFITNFPGIVIQVDTESEYEKIKTYYLEFKHKIFELFTSVNEFKNFLLNWNNKENVLEIIDAKINGAQELEGFSFINCTIEQGIINDSELINCDINNVDIQKSKIWDSKIKRSRLFYCNCNLNTILIDCFYNKGFFDGTMEGGIFRNGKLGDNAYLSSTTKKIVRLKKYFGESPLGDKKNPFSTDKKKNIDTFSDMITQNEINDSNQNPFDIYL